MQFKYTLLAVVLPLIINAEPIAKAEAEPEDVAAIAARAKGASIEKRSLSCKITGNQVNRRRCASTSCESIGQYAQGTTVTFNCYTTGENVNGGDSYWERDSAGFYVYDAYIALPCFGPENGLPHC
ncbi:hypothetical protein F5884DRAFT_897271 [Xylogone sp. PMI_703]|nr:hypothetical protein F5884DRAFT_897271 [Xylogone sp. PMI_703]